MSKACRLIVLVALILGIPAVARAQVAYTATLEGAQVAPSPTPTLPVASAYVILTNDINGGVKFFYGGLSSASTLVHIHSGAPGSNGPIEFTFTPSGSTGGGVNTFIAATAPQALLFRQGLMYIDIHTVNFPNGEVRGQLRPDGGFRGALTPQQVTTPATSAAVGRADIELDPRNQEASLNIFYTNLIGGHIGMHLHGPAMPGADGPIILTVSPSDSNTNVNFIQSLIAVSPTQVAQIKAGLWYVDIHTTAFPSGELRAQLKVKNKADDFDGDSRAELAVFRPSTGTWHTQNAASGLNASMPWGSSGDNPIPADFDGDGKADFCIFRNGVFWVRLSSTGATMIQPWGQIGDDPRAVADYDNDGRADFAVYRVGVNPGDQNYLYILQSVDGTVRIVPWGTRDNDTIVNGDFDGDRKADVATYNVITNTYWVLGSSAGLIVQPWGVFNTDWIVTQDYDGDGKTDYAVMRFSGPNVGTWFVLQSSTGTMTTMQFGLGTDIAVPGDYDGDGKSDAAIVRPIAANQYQWWILKSSTGTLAVAPFGLTTDQVVPFFQIR